MYNLLAGDAAVQAAFNIKPCAYVKNLPLDHFLSFMMNRKLRITHTSGITLPK